MEYRRLWHAGGAYFFTVNLLQRRNNDLLVRHVDYCHINPVKHGVVRQVKDWPCSTFHKLVKQGIFVEDWRGGIEGALSYAN